MSLEFENLENFNPRVLNSKLNMSDQEKYQSTKYGPLMRSIGKARKQNPQIRQVKKKRKQDILFRAMKTIGANNLTGKPQLDKFFRDNIDFKKFIADYEKIANIPQRLYNYKKNAGRESASASEEDEEE